MVGAVEVAVAVEPEGDAAHFFGVKADVMVGGLEFGRGLLPCEGNGGRVCGRLLLRLVAADAAEAFAGVDVGGGTHRLDREAVLVECLEVDGHVGGDLEVGTAVLRDRCGAEHAARQGLLAHPDHGLLEMAGGLWKNLHDADGVDMDVCLGRSGMNGFFYALTFTVGLLSSLA